MKEVVIVGGGIGGLAAAVALQRRGVEAHVYEAASGLSEVGAGIWVPPNAMQVLARLGVAEAVWGEGAPIRRSELRDARAGRLRVVDLSEAERRWGWPIVSIHRARLQRLLAGAVAPGTLHLGKACRGVSLAGDRVRVAFADGADEEAGVVIGADGIRSVVREAVVPGVPLRYSGQTSYRAVAAFELPAGLEGVGWEVWGAGRRFGFSPIGHGEVYGYATVDSPPGGRDDPGTTRSRLESLFAAFPSPIPEFLAAVSEDRILRTDMYDFRPVATWHRGRVVLLGDAAHATTPNLGQGGAQAIEDAWVLAERRAAAPDPAAAFREYERIRMPKARMVVNRSWSFGRLAHLANPVGRRLRNALLRRAPASMMRRQMEALYELGY